MITDEFPNQSIDNDYSGLLRAHQMDNMEYPPDPDEYYLTDEELQAEIVERIMNEETCIHGMSAWLCAHPIYHYPTDEMMNEGRYY